MSINNLLYRIGRVYKPKQEGKCWAYLTTCLGYCEKNARPGKLTCWHHHNAENKAQKLKKELE